MCPVVCNQNIRYVRLFSGSNAPNKKAMAVTMTQHKYKPHRGEEKNTDSRGRREAITDQGKLFRSVHVAMTQPIWEVAASTTWFGKRLRLVLILVATGVLVVEAVVSSPWPLIAVTTALFFAIGWARAGSTTP